jgi:hypothetical protein
LRCFGIVEPVSLDATLLPPVSLDIAVVPDEDGALEAVVLLLVPPVLPTTAGVAVVPAAPMVVPLPQLVIALTCAPPAWFARWSAATLLQSVDRRLVSVVELVDGGGVTPSLLPVLGSPVWTCAKAPAIAKAAADATRPLMNAAFIFQDSLSSFEWITGAHRRWTQG